MCLHLRSLSSRVVNKNSRYEYTIKHTYADTHINELRDMPHKEQIQEHRYIGIYFFVIEFLEILLINWCFR